MSLFQGVVGAQIELARISHPRDKLLRLAGIGRLFAEELAGTLALAPYGARAFALHRRLPAWAPPGASAANALRPCGEPSVARGVRYVAGPAAPPRCTVDVYVPPGLEPGAAQGAPVVLFAHGGVWAAGEAWHYAPMASTLARLGVVTAVMQYSLYPQALVPAMIEEVGAALSWALDSAAAYGGDPKQISLVGHSAGAQLCAMALLQRAAAAHAAASAARGPHGGQRTEQSVEARAQLGGAAAEFGGPSSQQQQGLDPQQQQQKQQQRSDEDVRMPARLVLMAGVYDIAKHYAYETDRGVHELSTMKRAVGGLAMAASVSPSVILGAALQRAGAAAAAAAAASAAPGAPSPRSTPTAAGKDRGGGGGGSGGSGGGADPDAALARFYDEFPLAGEAIAHRIGFDRGSGHHAAREAALLELALAGAEAVPAFPLGAARHLPPTVLMSSCTDLTVPWFESAEMFHRLVDAGVPAKHLVYNKVGHGDFVVNWPTGSPPSEADDDDLETQGSPDSPGSEAAHAPLESRPRLLRSLPPYARDLARVVAGAAAVDYVCAGGPDGGGRHGGSGSEVWRVGTGIVPGVPP